MCRIILISRSSVAFLSFLLCSFDFVLIWLSVCCCVSFSSCWGWDSGTALVRLSFSIVDLSFGVWLGVKGLGFRLSASGLQESR